MVEINDLQAGRAGEYLVCADLIINGYTAFCVESVLAYDVIIDINGNLLRVQVKTTREPKATPQRKEYTPVHRFNIRRMGKGGRQSYSSEQVDFFALVALDTRTIGYLHESQVRQTMDFRIKEFEGQYYGEINQDRRTQILELRSQGMTYSQIGKEVGIDRSQACRIVRGEGTQMEYRYLEDFVFEDAMRVYESNH